MPVGTVYDSQREKAPCVVIDDAGIPRVTSLGDSQDDVITPTKWPGVDVSLGRDRRETNESASFTCDSDMRSEGFSWSRAPTVVSRRMQVAACVKGRIPRHRHPRKHVDVGVVLCGLNRHHWHTHTHTCCLLKQHARIFIDCNTFYMPFRSGKTPVG